MVKKPFALLALATVASLSQASTFVIPHILEKSGVILGVGYNPRGAQLRSAKSPTGAQLFEDLSFECSPEGSTPLIDEIIDEFHIVHPPGTPPGTWKVHRIEPRRSGLAAGGTLMIVDSITATGLGIPALDDSGRTSSFFDIFLEIEDRASDGFLAATAAEQRLGTKQKAWLCSNFKLSIEGLSTHGVHNMDPITVRPGLADVDQDGIPDLEVSDPVIYMDAASAQEYRSWSNQAAAAGHDPRRMTLTLNDSTGKRICQLAWDVEPASIGFFDIFTEFSPFPNAPVQMNLKSKELTGHVTLIK